MARSTTRKTTSSKSKSTAAKTPARSSTAATSKGVTAPKTTAPASAPKRAMRIPPPPPRPTAETGEAPSGPDLKKQELLQKVVTRSGIKKKDAKPVVEAMLEVLGEALADGRELNLQPFGKLKHNRTKETPTARIIVAKIRQSKKSGDTAKDTVAAAAE